MLRFTLLFAVLAGCAEGDRLQSWERERLQALTLSANDPTPAAIGNPFADVPDAAQLGQLLYHDEGLSFPVDGAAPLSCNTCHDVEAGGHDVRGTPTSLGAGGGYTGRNSPTIFNSAWRATAEQPGWGWLGEKPSMSAQIQVPLLGGPHNGDPLVITEYVATTYLDEYLRVFGEPPALPAGPYSALGATEQAVVDEVFDNVTYALEAYVRTLRVDDTPFDLAMAGDDAAMSEAAWRGAELFIGDGFCLQCHSGPTLSDYRPHNVGVSQANGPTVPAVDGGPGTFVTPTLRNVGLTGPYMHNGSLPDLWSVLEFYRFGGHGSGYVGTSELVPLNLSDDNLLDLEAFLLALTEEQPIPEER
ncbi:MAG: hypothetical protein KC912_16565 [Proteobacteria bacterium]|nr:hypothetical protein [Pseudomonadota bacterium]